MRPSIVDMAIIGAGPYGLSIAAHLRKTPLTFRIFGTPMQSWSESMPKGMLLRSEGFASSLYDPEGSFTLRHYCEEKCLPYADVGKPVPLEVFTAYGMEFQERLVPMLERTSVDSVRQTHGAFELRTSRGEVVLAHRVIVAAGIAQFHYLPPFLAGLPSELVTHSASHRDVSSFSGRTVCVVGAGASALDLAALLQEAGAYVELVARCRRILFRRSPSEPRPRFAQMLNPRSGLGMGWSSRLCSDAPLLLHMMPRPLRLHAAERPLGAVPEWLGGDRAASRVPMHLGVQIKGAVIRDGKVHLEFVDADGKHQAIAADHLIGATGYRPSLSRLAFLDESLRKRIRTVEDAPVLSRCFESSVAGLYMVGLLSAGSFGPLTRFACGARFTASHLTRHLAATA